MSKYVKTIGSEVEFSQREEQKLKRFFMIFNKGEMYSSLLTKKRSNDRMYIENETIYEYRSPVISADSYYRFTKYYFFVSYFSDKYHVEGYNDSSAGSFHTHLKFKPEYINLDCIYYLNNITALMPFMARNIDGLGAMFRDAVKVEDDYGYSSIEYQNDIEYDSKTYWITYNTGSQCIEVRLNENIPVWYILLDYLPMNKDIYGIYWEDISINKHIDNIIKKARSKTKFKNDIQQKYYFILLNYLEYYWEEAKKGNFISIQTFAQYLLSVQPNRFNKLLDEYTEIEQQMPQLEWYSD